MPLSYHIIDFTTSYSFYINFSFSRILVFSLFDYRLLYWFLFTPYYFFILFPGRPTFLSFLPFLLYLIYLLSYYYHHYHYYYYHYHKMFCLIVTCSCWVFSDLRYFGMDRELFRWGVLCRYSWHFASIHPFCLLFYFHLFFPVHGISVGLFTRFCPSICLFSLSHCYLVIIGHHALSLQYLVLTIFQFRHFFSQSDVTMWWTANFIWQCNIMWFMCLPNFNEHLMGKDDV